MKLLVTGAGGMLGSALVPTLAEAGHDVWPTDLRMIPPTTFATDHRGRVNGHSVPSGNGHASYEPHPWGGLGLLDVRRPDHIADWMARVQPDMVVQLAAETDVDRCEADPDHAYATNALATKHIALACQQADVPLAYVSTAGVFDGQKDDPYTEYDEPRPINVYGQSKLEGEHYVRWFLQRFYIVRAGWMVGGGDRDHKFVAKILRQLDEGAHTIYAVGDKWGTPTYAPDFARCFTRLIDTESYGLYHMACLGQGTRYDVAKRILHVMGLEDEVELIEVDSEFFREAFPAPRPRSEMMRNYLLDLQGMNTMRPWEESLDEYLVTSFGDRCHGPAAAAARLKNANREKLRSGHQVRGGAG